MEFTTQFPYGIADFRGIRNEGMFYLDRTWGIRDVERLGRTLVFLRPRRFGKSLWLQTLATYYDLRQADDFETLFGGLEAGQSPTPLRHRYFVLQWNFSEVSARGTVDEISRRLHNYINRRIEDFLITYEDQIPGPVTVDEDPTNTLRHLLTRIRQTPFALCLLIDEYDNFVNEIMVKDATTYRALFDNDGPFKEIFKSVKSGTEGQGLERVFVTGVSPVALNDLTSGFNIAEDVSRHPALAALCGFQEAEIRETLEQIAAARRLEVSPDELLDVMRTWYNGYRFTGDSEDLVYNPTNVLYFLKHLVELGRPPQALYDQNLRTDRGKLHFLAQTSAGSGVIEQLTEGDGTVKIRQLETGFSLDDLLTRIGEDDQFVASFLYYMGLLTLTQDVPPRLRIPNLVVHKLFLDRLLEIYLPSPNDFRAAQRAADAFLEEGQLSHLINLFEQSLLPALSNRDLGAAPKRPELSGGGVNEKVLKAILLSVLFDDHRYVVFSEMELEHRYADLCLLVRPEMRRYEFFDVIFELKWVRGRELGKSARKLREMEDSTLRELTPIAKALADARQQALGYREALAQKLGVVPRCYVLVAVGLERVLGEEVPNLQPQTMPS